jgi:hypothetical protein
VSLVVLVPMLGRPHHVAPLLESIRATCAARVLFLLTPGDTEVEEAVADEEHDFIDWQSGDYGRKINHGIRTTTEEHIFTGASDLRFHPGWYEKAVAKLAPGIGVVGTNDLGNRRTAVGFHATHMLVTRAYVEEFGTVDEPGKFYHEGYPHELVDDEAVGTAKSRGAYAHAVDSIVEHLHPLWGKGEWDETYAAIPERIRIGQRLFKERRPMWRRLT